jgi:F-actin capping protein alpha subunit
MQLTTARKSLLKSLSSHTSEHYQSSSIGAYPIESDSQIAIIIVANRYSPNNYWNGRWRSFFVYNPSSGSLAGSIKVDVHYYEDGNVRMLTSKPVSAAIGSRASGADIVKQIAQAERKYQEELNRGFSQLSEQAFKGLRRQLPVTRQKIEWDKVASYKVGYVSKLAGELYGNVIANQTQARHWWWKTQINVSHRA